ncbi:hypothetical protein BXZ70DRAFT_999481 [Cristinia sonorae]|uniref:Arrestin-like N-terminal domain-containing protein n=1 Tax=Cristinia sonorae TaxID=1940300 RepID=A0A8K0XRA8_9AGAR|nr:hypothetical protein BXZ70DRAFT_999481 [Cristinia sonorae]
MSPNSSMPSSSRLPSYDGRRHTSNYGNHRGSTASINSSQWTEHHYTLSDARDPPWATLMVRSRAPLPTHLPSTFEGEDITGEILLDLTREDSSIKGVVVSIIGQITTSAIDMHPFLTLRQELWSADMGDPGQRRGAPFNGKLLGRYRWPFTFKIPPYVEFAGSSGSNETFRVPPSFSERMTRVHIQYQLIAVIRRGKFRIDNQLSTVFSFTPFIHPAPFTEARQEAYRHGHPIPGPDQDPEGWESLTSVDVGGTVFSTRAVDAKCRLSLAKPLSYTRGTVIPCSLCIECSDAQALDLLSMPQAIDIRLLRHISKVTTEVVSKSTGKSKYAVDFEQTAQEIRSAVWWLSYDDSYRRVLCGEIHLPKDLKPNCRIGKFDLHVRSIPSDCSLSYTVEMFPMKAIAFSSHETTAAALLVQPVEIVTAYSAGPRPRTYSPSLPPGYNDASSSTRPSSEYSFRV